MSQRGDTIVEVLFAVTVFSMVAVGGLSLMNQGTAMAQRSLEISLVRDQMDAQADALRYMHDAYIASFEENGAAASVAWNDVSKARAVPAAQEFSDMTDGRTCRLPVSATPSSADSDGRAFALDIRKLDGQNGSPAMLLIQSDNVDATPTYAQVRYDPPGLPKAEGIWVQSVYSPGVGGVLGFYDFHIRACWLSPGQSIPVTLGTIVRLYDPAS